MYLLNSLGYFQICYDLVTGFSNIILLKGPVNSSKLNLYSYAENTGFSLKRALLYLCWQSGRYGKELSHPYQASSDSKDLGVFCSPHSFIESSRKHCNYFSILHSPVNCVFLYIGYISYTLSDILKYFS